MPAEDAASPDTNGDDGPGARRLPFSRVEPHWPEVRLEDFRPWDTIRPDGCTLAQAIEELVPTALRSHVALRLAFESVGRPHHMTLAEWRESMWHGILPELRAGRLVMLAMPLGSEQERKIEPRWLEDADPDFDRNRIECGGLEFWSVRVLPAGLRAAEEPAGGWPLRLAVRHLVTEKFRSLAMQLDQMERAFDPGHPGSTRTRRLLWDDLCGRLLRGEVTARGRRPGQPKLEAIDPEFFIDATPDYNNDTVSVPDLTYYAVRLRTAEVSSTRDAAPAPPSEIASANDDRREPDLVRPRTGPRPQKSEAARTAIETALRSGVITLNKLVDLKRKELPGMFPGFSEATLWKVRREVIETLTNSARTLPNNK